MILKIKNKKALTSIYCKNQFSSFQSNFAACSTFVFIYTLFSCFHINVRDVRMLFWANNSIFICSSHFWSLITDWHQFIHFHQMLYLFYAYLRGVRLKLYPLFWGAIFKMTGICVQCILIVANVGKSFFFFLISVINR